MAGGGRRPTRCRAASTSASTPRRARSEFAQLVLVGRQRTQAALGPVAGGLQLLHLARCVEQRLVERGAVLVDGVDLVGEFGAPLVAEREVAGDGVEFGLAGGAQAGLAAVDGGLGNRGACGERADRKRYGEAQPHVGRGLPSVGRSDVKLGTIG